MSENGAETRHHPQRIGGATELRQPLAHVGVIGQRVLDGVGRGIDHLGQLGADVAPGGGIARLHHDGPPLLRRPGVQRTAHLEMFALEIQPVHPAFVEEDPRLLVKHEGPVFPAVPEPGHRLGAFGGALVALAIVAHLFKAEILGLLVRP